MKNMMNNECHRYTSIVCLIYMKLTASRFTQFNWFSLNSEHRETTKNKRIKGDTLVWNKLFRHKSSKI